MSAVSSTPVFTACFTVLLLAVGGGSVAAGPAGEPPSADSLAIEWAVASNLVDEGAKFRSRLTLTNRGKTALPASGWTIYFNFPRPIDSTSVSGAVDFTRINGDFYRLRPDANFEPVAPGTERVITFEANGSAIKAIDAPAGFYVVYPEAAPTPISDVTTAPFTRPEQTKRSPNDVVPVPTPSRRHQANEALSTLPADSVGRIVPTPASMERRAGSFSLSAASAIEYEKGLATEAQRLAEGLESVLGRRPATTREAETPAVVLRREDVTAPTADTVHAEAYRLSVDPSGGIEIVGTSAAGVFYGMQSLQAWLPVSAYESASPPVSVPAVRVADAPRFGYRGLHLDVSRNFQSAAAVKQLMDVMASYKLNTFHFHLTDDEGWRLAIDGLPELTEVGGRRGHTTRERNHLIPSYGSGPNPRPTMSRGSGWYTQREYLDILRYADARHIEVMPEIDMPGHARAALKAMKARSRRLLEAGDTSAARRYRLHDPKDESEYESVQGWDDNVVNVCQPSTYRFLVDVVDELIALHEEADAPLHAVHVGGDEVPEGAWTESPVCDDYIARTEDVEAADDLFGAFLNRFRDSLATRGLTMGGWEEVGMTEAEHRETTTTPNEDLVGKDVRPYVWSNIWGGGTEDRAYRLANAGYDVVMSQATNFYFDMAYDKHPREAGYYWAGFVDTEAPFAFVPFDLYKSADRTSMGHPINPDTAFADHARLADSAQSNILGLQGQLWGETLRSTDRMEYMAVPRLLSLAERAWAPQPDWATLDDIDRLREQRTTAWNAFANRLGQRELPRLSLRHGEWTYRLPPPGAVIRNDTLRASVSPPGLPVRYTTDGTTPTPDSPRYEGSVAVPEGATVRLRTFDGHGRGSRPTTVTSSP